MRNLIVGLVTAAALASTAFAQSPGDNPFQREKGQLRPPAAPVAAPSSATAPPQGPTASGLDFGAWRGADAAVYGPSFERRIRTHIGGKSLTEARATLQTDGFSCVDPANRGGAGPVLECRIAIRDNGCGVEWWTVIEEPLAAPKAGFDRMCR